MKLLTSFILSLLAFSMMAQKSAITGMVTDTSGAALTSATVILTDARDSVIAGYVSTDPDGRFTMKRVVAGKYWLQINHTGMVAHTQSVDVTGQPPNMDLGTIRLLPEDVLLRGVDITATAAPLRLRSDTIEYNTAYFQTQPGAVVEDLLKKLPSVQIMPDGTIKAQGETVRKVLVDGKEFFGDDPKMATKNLPADAVDKVQLYNKKSDRAEFTGVEDGQKEKTINLELKADAKRGYFGKATAGYGTQNRYDGQFNLNRFSGKTQVSAIGAANNTNRQAFSFNDYLNFMGGIGNMMSGGSKNGRVEVNLDNNSLGMPNLGDGPQNGFTASSGVGLNLNRDFSKKAKFNAHYFFNRIANNTDQTQQRQSFGGESGFNSMEWSDESSSNNSHRLNLSLKTKLDSFNQLDFKSRWGWNGSGFDRQSDLQSESSLAQSRALRDYALNGNQWSGDATLTWKRRFERKGRALFADATFQSSTDQKKAALAASNRYDEVMVTADSLRQRQTYDDAGTRLGASVSYTEPMGRRQYLEWSVNHSQYINDLSKQFYDTLGGQEQYNPLLSTRFQRGYRYEQVGMSYLRSRKKSQLTIGTQFQQSVLEGNSTDPGIPAVNRTFKRMLPFAMYHYEPAIGANMSISYNTRLREPALEQLQPLVDNSQPLQVYAGNPNLQPEYAHEIRADYMRYDGFSNTLVFASAQGGYTKDKIVNRTEVDSLLRNFIQPVNAAYEWNANAFLNFSRPFRPLKINVNLTLNTLWTRGYTWVNTLQTTTTRSQNWSEIYFDNRKKTNWEWRVGGRLTHNRVDYTENEAFDQQYFTHRYFGEATWFPNTKWILNTELNYRFYPQAAFGAETSIPLWSASVGRYFLKNRKGKVQLSAFDLFNRNKGIARSNQLNFVEETRTVNLARYFMVQFSYSISGFPDRNAGGIEVKRVTSY